MLLGYRTANSGMTLGMAIDHVVESEAPVETAMSADGGDLELVVTAAAEPGVPIRVTKLAAYHSSRSEAPAELLGFQRHEREVHDDLVAMDGAEDLVVKPALGLLHPRAQRVGEGALHAIDVLLERAVVGADGHAVIVYNGTLARQETTAGTIGELVAHVREQHRKEPAILVVGRVAAFREHLRWFDTRPLFGTRVLVTRPRDQAAEMVDRLAKMGAETIEAPMIRIVPPEDLGPLRAAADSIGDFDWIETPRGERKQAEAYLRTKALQALAEIGDQETLRRLRSFKGDGHTSWPPEVERVFYMTSEEINWRMNAG